MTNVICIIGMWRGVQRQRRVKRVHFYRLTQPDRNIPWSPDFGWAAFSICYCERLGWKRGTAQDESKQGISRQFWSFP